MPPPPGHRPLPPTTNITVFRIPKSAQAAITKGQTIKAIDDWVKKNVPPDSQIQINAKGTKNYPGALPDAGALQISSFHV